jgi:hypothetical protein
MTIDRRIPPAAGAYNAAILACACSGSKVYVNEAFRLAKEMLDSHRDAHGRSAFRPDSRTFGALLEGAKRIGDLGRVRWILAEMIEVSRRDPESKDVVVDERIMMHVFRSYATYEPPFRRSMAPLAYQKTQIHLYRPGHQSRSSHHLMTANRRHIWMLLKGPALRIVPLRASPN